ncbi:hypothetical protein ABZY45_19735 [Streptomyces sp. NPDC006516]|uniref:hypothetical protein n=1 Tax=Streptomyces sp. NPDC006516 TaxID=3154309 RepID=UPI0033B621C3
MAFALFTRRPAVAEPEPQPWPTIGETWQPEGVTIAQRYYNLATAVVLVYSTDETTDETTDDMIAMNRHTVVCLGCH